jgi:hypothetical protein
MNVFKVFSDDINAWGEGGSRDWRTESKVIKSVGDEKERFGGGESIESGGGGKRNDLVDQVLTLLMEDASERILSC